MKIVVFGDSKRVGVLHAGRVVDANWAFERFLRERGGEPHPAAMAAAIVPPGLEPFIEGGERTLEGVRNALEHLEPRLAELEEIVYTVGTVRLHAPRTDRARIACAGGNFGDHAAAMAARGRDAAGQSFAGDFTREIRSRGIWGFWKIDRESCGPEDEVIYPSSATRLDYEGEVAVVIGKRGKDIAADRFDSHIWGVTLFVDWSARDVREANAPHKFAKSKNFDTCASLGPCIVVGELDPGDIWIETAVNGEQRQHFSTRDMAFSFAEFGEYLSRDLTLYPGDMIASGTGAGTAMDSSPVLASGVVAPERFLKPGDVVEVKSEAIGVLRNRIIAKG